jgi:purine-binding chemotaxis protein CheW
MQDSVDGKGGMGDQYTGVVTEVPSMPGVGYAQGRQSSNANDPAITQLMDGTPERVAQTYRERATKLARSSAAEFKDATTPVLVFRLNEDRYGIELADVGSVVAALRCTPVPESAAHLEGLINVSGTVRPVLNLRLILGLTLARENCGAYFLMVRRKQRELGLKVEQIDQVQRVSLTELQCQGGGSRASCIRGVTPEMLTILDTDDLIGRFWKEGADS